MSIRNLWAVLVALVLVFGVAGVAAAKSLYVIASHDGTYSAYNINPDGTVTYQASYPSGSWGPAGMAVHDLSATLFVTYEFSGSVVIVDAVTMTGLGSVPAPGASDLAGIDVDDINNVVYAVDRWSQNVYAYDWNASTTTLTLQPGYPQTLATCEGAMGVALDEMAGVLYVACVSWSSSGTVRGYDVTTWSQTMSYTPAVPPVGIAIDRIRGFVYVTAPAGGCANAPASYTKLSRYDLLTAAETVVDIGHGGMGLAVDELHGYVYVTGGCDGDDLSVWDTNLAMMQSTGPIGSPAGLAIGNVSFNPLNLTKDDGLPGDGCMMPGGTFTYQLCYDNLANPFNVTGATLTDTLPTELSYVSSTGAYNAGTHSVDWALGNLTAGSAGACLDLDVTLDAAAVPTSNFTNQVTIDSNETPPTTVAETTEVCDWEICQGVNPIAWWKFDENAGIDAYDSSGNGNDGVLKSYPTHHYSGAGVPVWTAGQTGATDDHALEFDGSNGYVNAGSDSSLDNLKAFTYTAWVKRAADGDLEIFSKRNSYHEMRFKGEGVLRGCVVANRANACSDSAETVPLDTWTHVAMAYDHYGDKKVHLYINGGEVTYAAQSTARGQVKWDASSPQMLGRRQNNTRYYWGVLDDMRIYGEACAEP